MKAREYCCCAIPILYAGIYTALLEQLVLGVVAGTLSIATPSIVGASTPSFAKWIFAVACWLGAAIQVLGFIAVLRERPVLYRHYANLHILVTVATFGIAAAWIIMSATRHDQAQAQCIVDFFANTVSATNDEGRTLCNIFPWADVGIMGGLWVLLAIVQLYLCVVLAGFGKSQRHDHALYQSLLDNSEKTLDNVPLANRGAWDSRNSGDDFVQPGGHARQNSTASVATVMADKVQGYSDYPPYAHTMSPTPTPKAYEYDPYYVDSRLEPALKHPDPDAEGTLRRKTPRLRGAGSEDFTVPQRTNSNTNPY